MPIHRVFDFTDVSDSEFDLIDEAVMRSAYATQNRFGRLFDERVYENNMAARLRAEGFEVHTQVPMTVTYNSFKKKYYLDLVVNQVLYELKVVSALLDEHKAQVLNYAMLQDIRRAKLINFGETRVRGQLLRNAVSQDRRHHPILRNLGWRSLTPQCESLLAHLRSIIKDWGTHLSCQLYNEAILHFLGGEAHCLQRVEILADGVPLGSHRVQMLAPNFAFAVTCLTSNQAHYDNHLETLLAHTSLEAIQWINLNHSQIELKTRCRSPADGKGITAME